MISVILLFGGWAIRFCLAASYGPLALRLSIAADLLLSEVLVRNNNYNLNIVIGLSCLIN
jgi:hypothetical protein